MAGSSISTVKAYLDSLEAPRRAIIEPLHTRILERFPGLTARICYGMIGYGFPGDADGPDWIRIGLGSQKHHIGLYVCDGAAIEWLKQNPASLGKVSLGKSCVRFKKAGDLNDDAAFELMNRAVHGRMPPST